MSVFKIEKTKDYTVMSNFHLRDKDLSYKAKGLLSFMLSLPEEWDYSMNGLVSISKENIKAIRTILQELETKKYLIRTRFQNERGQFQYNYSIYEIPYDLQRHTVKGQMQIANAVDGLQINNNEKIDKDDKTKSPFFIAEEHNILTLELIHKGYITKEDTQLFYYDKLFENLLNNDNSYKDLLQIIHYIIPRVLNRNFKDEEGNRISNKFGYLKNSIISNLNKLKNPIENLWDDLDSLDDLLNF